MDRLDSVDLAVDSKCAVELAVHKVLHLITHHCYMYCLLLMMIHSIRPNMHCLISIASVPDDQVCLTTIHVSDPHNLASTVFNMNRCERMERWIIVFLCYFLCLSVTFVSNFNRKINVSGIDRYFFYASIANLLFEMSLTSISKDVIQNQCNSTKKKIAQTFCLFSFAFCDFT